MKQPQPRTQKGRPRAFDVDEALDRAMHVFWRNGYLGASLSDLTEAMGINRPSLYAAFGNKEELFRKALDRYAQRTAACLREALQEPTARRVAERVMQGVAEMATDACHPPGCLWVHGALSCGNPDDPLRHEVAMRRNATEVELRKRFERSVAEGDLPAEAEPAALARLIVVVNCGMSILAATGAGREELLAVVRAALRAWPTPSTLGPKSRLSHKD